MKKAICDKCNSLITIDESSPTTNCPKCKAQIFTDTVIKNYLKTISTYRRKADLAFTNLANYQEAYRNYKLYYNLLNDNLGALLAVGIARIRCSTVHKIFIHEAIDFVIDGSDKVEINYENVNVLNDSLTKMKSDAKLIVDTFNEVKSVSKYALKMYHEALEQYKYFLTKYLELYKGLDKFNKYLANNDVTINEEISNYTKKYNMIQGDLKKILEQCGEKIKQIAETADVEVALTNHTAFDSGLQRIEYSKARMNHLPNIYLLGIKGVLDFLDVFRIMAE